MKNQIEVIKDKIIDKGEILPVLAQWRLKSQKIVFTNGCFDILHQGHIDYLAKAADLGDKLIIGLNTDSSVKLLDKGEERPIQDQDSRAVLLAALAFTDAIVFFDEETPLQLIELIKPDILVKGSDYSINNIVGSDLVLKNGGQVKTIDFLPGFSTSKIVNKIKKA